MNIRQQLYKKFRLEGMSAYAAALKAGYSRNTAKNANKYMEKYGMETWLEMMGLTDKKLAEHAQRGLEAMKPVACDVMIRNENGELKVTKNENDWIEYEDWNVRHKYYETILKLRKKLIDVPLVDQSQHKHTYNVINYGGNGKANTSSRVRQLDTPIAVGSPQSV